MATVKVILNHPLTDNDGEVYDTLHLRRPTVKDLKTFDSAKGEVEKIATLISRLATNANGSALAPYLVDKIDAVDFGKLGEIIGGFFDPSPPTGETS